MISHRFLRKLNTSLSSGLRFFLIAVVGLVLISCGASLPEKKPNTADSPIAASPLAQSSSPREVVKTPVSITSPRAPWEVWPEEDFGNLRLSQVDQLVRNGELEKAEQDYRDLELSDESFLVTKAAFTRQLSSMLKLDRSKEVLGELSKHVSKSGQRIDDLSPELTLIACFAYQHRKNTDQAFAWLSLAERQSAGKDPVSAAATKLAREIAESLSNSSFEQATEKWRADVFLSPLLEEEKLRRANGGSAQFASAVNWFAADTYRVKPQDSLLGDDLVGSDQFTIESGSSAFAIGVLLPLSGQYATHGEQVKRGIELALEAIAEESRPQVFFEDTRGDEFVAAQAYQRLVDEQKVSIVLGPLLSRTTELVAQQSARTGVPIISFTKRPGISNLGTTVFRLGATSRGQVVDLVSFAVSRLGVKSFAVLYPNNSNGDELTEAFADEVGKRGGHLVIRASYNRDDQLSLERAVSKVESSGAQAVFIPDTIESAYPLLTLLRAPATNEVGEAIEKKQLTLLGPAFWDDPVAIRGYGPLLDNSFYVTAFNLHSRDPYVVEFIDRFKAANGVDPDVLSAQGYDALRLSVFALKDSKGSRARTIEALRSAHGFPGVTGMLSVSSDGEIVRQMSIIRLFNGEASDVSPFGMNESASFSQQEDPR